MLKSLGLFIFPLSFHKLKRTRLVSACLFLQLSIVDPSIRKCLMLASHMAHRLVAADRDYDRTRQVGAKTTILRKMRSSYVVISKWPKLSAQSGGGTRSKRVRNCRETSAINRLTSCSGPISTSWHLPPPARGYGALMLFRRSRVITLRLL